MSNGFEFPFEIWEFVYSVTPRGEVGSSRVLGIYYGELCIAEQPEPFIICGAQPGMQFQSIRNLIEAETRRLLPLCEQSGQTAHITLRIVDEMHYHGGRFRGYIGVVSDADYQSLPESDRQKLEIAVTLVKPDDGPGSNP